MFDPEMRVCFCQKWQLYVVNQGELATQTTRHARSCAWDWASANRTEKLKEMFRRLEDAPAYTPRKEHLKFRVHERVPPEG